MDKIDSRPDKIKPERGGKTFICIGSSSNSNEISFIIEIVNSCSDLNHRFLFQMLIKHQAKLL